MYDLGLLLGDVFSMPRCALCDVPVEGLYADIDPETGTLLLVAQCHDDFDTQAIAPEIWVSASDVRFEWAFGPEVPHEQH